MPLFPKSSVDWAQSFARPLFLACVGLLCVAVWGGNDGGHGWGYWGHPLAGIALPLLGALLGLVCLVSPRWTGRTKKGAWIIAALSVVLGPLLQPVLQ